MNVRIGIDARLLRKTGVGVYLRNLFLEFETLFPQEWTPVVFVCPEDREVARKYFPRAELVVVDARWHSFAEQIAGLYRFLNARVDLMHFPYFSYPVLYPKPFVATVHDLTLLETTTGKVSTRHPLIYKLKHTVFKQVIYSQIKRALRILVPTKTVQNSIATMYTAIPTEKITVTYEGVDKELQQAKPNNELTKKIPANQYILYVGNFYPHKNIMRLLDAFQGVETTARLVLAGPSDFFATEVRNKIKVLDLTKRVHLYENPDVEDLAYLYTNALALIHPSLAEGFGLPLVEAMYYRLPIIASRIPVFKELLGNNYLSFDPHDVTDIRMSLQAFFDTPPTKYEYERLSLFDFHTMAVATIKIYREALQDV